MTQLTDGLLQFLIIYDFRTSEEVSACIRTPLNDSFAVQTLYPLSRSLSLLLDIFKQVEGLLL